MVHDRHVAARVFHTDQLTSDWLTEVMGVSDEVTSFQLDQIGTGQVGANFRLLLTWRDGTGPSSVVAKFAALDEQSRETGVQTLTYEREVAFYRELRDTVAIEAPHTYVVDIRPGTADVLVLMEDLAPRVQGDQLAGCSLDEAELAMLQAARLHGPRWGDPALWDYEWLNRRSGDEVDGAAGMLALLYPAFVDRFRNLLTAGALEVGAALVGGIDDWFRTAPPPVTVIHGDYRLDNMMFGRGTDRPLVVVDWQTPGHGHGANDVAYFLGAGLLPSVREAHEQDLVRAYHAELVRFPAAAEVSFEECWEQYRRHAFSGFVMAVVASMIVGRTQRGDAMFMAMANRHAEQVLHLGSLEFLDS